MKLVVDGVFFQLTNSGIARVWSSILPRLASRPDLDIVLLNRGNCPSFDGIQNIDFPSYKMDSNTAADSFLLQRFCEEVGAEVFTSTYYTTPLTTPSVLVVYDMIPEVLGFDLTQRPWQEKQLAIGHASKFACISEQTRRDLERFYPKTIGDSITAHCGVDRGVFFPRDHLSVSKFRQAFGINRSYYLLVGSREQHLGYKNAAIAFKAIGRIPADVDLLCIGGEPQISSDALAFLPPNIAARRLELQDADLACAYSGAEALVYPSLYEGFGMPVVEAMACGCPVITTRHGSLGEIIGDAPVVVSGHDIEELESAMIKVREADTRAKLIDKGHRQATRFTWDSMANKLAEQIRAAFEDVDRRNFLRKWKELRSIQAAVDVS